MVPFSVVRTLNEGKYFDVVEDETIFDKSGSFVLATFGSIAVKDETIFDEIECFTTLGSIVVKLKDETIFDESECFLLSTFDSIVVKDETIFDESGSFVLATFDSIVVKDETIFDESECFTTFGSIVVDDETIFDESECFTTFGSIVVEDETICFQLCWNSSWMLVEDERTLNKRDCLQLAIWMLDDDETTAIALQKLIASSSCLGATVAIDVNIFAEPSMYTAVVSFILLARPFLLSWFLETKTEEGEVILLDDVACARRLLKEVAGVACRWKLVSREV